MPDDTITLNIALPEEMPDAEPVNYFGFSRVGRQVEMLVGYMDVGKLVPVLQAGGQKEGDQPIPVRMRARFYMEAESMRILIDKATEIWEAMVKSGHTEPLKEAKGRAKDGHG